MTTQLFTKPAAAIDQQIIDLYDAFTHSVLDRRSFSARLTKLTGSITSATALLPLLAARKNMRYLFTKAPIMPLITIPPQRVTTSRLPSWHGRAQWIFLTRIYTFEFGKTISR